MRKTASRHRADEQISLIIWTKEDVLAVLDDDSVTEEQAAEILAQIEGVDGHHEYGIDEDTLRVMLDNIREQDKQAREVCVSAAALAQVLRVAGDFMRLEDAQGGEGSALRLWPHENAAMKK
ncbi:MULTISPECIES: DUF1380 family protein [Enterobacterales]|uniref:DUF1380 family protein n=1 Tax=Enterobacterales TaxID=91347 RepID=UPI00141E22AA|nr:MULTISPECIES: DUF1380 family protein [Enterobacterales]